MNPVTKKWNEIIDDLEHNVIKIYGQRSMLKTYDLIYHTVQSFFFNGKYVERGWGDVLVIGSPRCGKSEAAKQYINFVEAGEMITGENVSYAGLVGGVRMTDHSQMIMWGKYARNDGKLVICDELSNLSMDDIGRLSALRSSGIAEVTKIQSNKAHARTRKVFISNPRDGSDLVQLDFPIYSIKSLMGRLEDIARFDVILGVTSTGITPTFISESQKEKIEHKFTAKLCHERIMWAWSRTPEQVKFSTGAKDAIYKLADYHVNNWSSSVPMVVGPEQPERIARLCCALAARVYSTDSTGELLLVEPVHVEAVGEFMEQLFNDPGLRYNYFVDREHAKEKQFQNMKQLAEVFRENIPEYQQVIRVFLDNKFVSSNQLGQEIYSLTPEQSKKVISHMVQLNLISKYRNDGYKKLGKFNQLIRSEFENIIKDFSVNFGNVKESEDF